MSTKLLKRFSRLFLLLLTVSSPALAQGDLMIMPKRIVFQGMERSQEVSLANTGEQPATYAISFINYKMTEDGKFVEIDVPEEGQRFAAEFLRYFPRRVTLAPGEAQTVRIQLNRAGNLEPGEYRSHMYFRSVEEQTALGQEEVQEEDGISININTVFGISIPVIIKEGPSTTEIGLEVKDLLMEGEYPELSLVMKRAGNMSTYGNIKVEHISPDGKTTEIGLIKGVAVYSPNSKRNISFELRDAGKVDLNSGKLSISYSEDQGQTLARAIYDLE